MGKFPILECDGSRNRRLFARVARASPCFSRLAGYFSEIAAQLLTELNAGGITILLVTHEQEMAAFARTIVHFRDGLIEGIERRAKGKAGVPA